MIVKKSELMIVLECTTMSSETNPSWNAQYWSILYYDPKMNSTNPSWNALRETSSLKLNGILSEDIQESSINGFPAMQVLRMSSCSFLRSINPIICPGRLLWRDAEAARLRGSVGKACGKQFLLCMSCRRSAGALDLYEEE